MTTSTSKDVSGNVIDNVMGNITGSITITRPDDWHLHLRDGATIASVLPHTARQFARAIEVGS